MVTKLLTLSVAVSVCFGGSLLGSDQNENWSIAKSIEGFEEIGSITANSKREVYASLSGIVPVEASDPNSSMLMPPPLEVNAVDPSISGSADAVSSIGVDTSSRLGSIGIGGIARVDSQGLVAISSGDAEATIVVNGNVIPSWDGAVLGGGIDTTAGPQNAHQVLIDPVYFITANHPDGVLAFSARFEANAGGRSVLEPRASDNAPLLTLSDTSVFGTTGSLSINIEGIVPDGNDGLGSGLEISFVGGEIGQIVASGVFELYADCNEIAVGDDMDDVAETPLLWTLKPDANGQQMCDELRRPFELEYDHQRSDPLVNIFMKSQAYYRERGRDVTTYHDFGFTEPAAATPNESLWIPSDNYTQIASQGVTPELLRGDGHDFAGFVRTDLSAKGNAATLLFDKDTNVNVDPIRQVHADVELRAAGSGASTGVIAIGLVADSSVASVLAPFSSDPNLKDGLLVQLDFANGIARVIESEGRSPDPIRIREAALRLLEQQSDWSQLNVVLENQADFSVLDVTIGPVGSRDVVKLIDGVRLRRKFDGEDQLVVAGMQTGSGAAPFSLDLNHVRLTRRREFDLDWSGGIGITDIDLLDAFVRSEADYVRSFDLNFDNRVDAMDILLGEDFLPGLSQGDVNRDGMVAFEDFLILSDRFGESVNTRALGDLDGDGVVAFADFLSLSAAFGQRFQTPANVPEPGCCRHVFLIAAVCSMAGRRRKRPVGGVSNE